MVETKNSERGRGYWKMNVSLLQEQKFIDGINQEIQICSESMSQKNPVEKWEILKTRIKKFAVKYSRDRKSENALIIGYLSETVNEYESRMPLTKEEDNLLQNIREDLEDKLFEKAKGQIFRSKVRWYEEGEKNSKYFFSLEKAKYNAKTCYKLLSEAGQEITNQEEILETQKNYYQELYQQDIDVQFNLVNTYNIKVPEGIKQEQNNQLTEVDLQEAIKGMKNSKTPGEDGIPADFYKVFWTKIKTIFMEMVLEVYNQKLLHKSARK